jgi:D-alanine-D-alanine ligase
MEKSKTHDKYDRSGHQRVRVGVVFGGKSAEHDVSLMSASSVLRALDPDRFEIIPLAISREGAWLPPPVAIGLLPSGDYPSLQAAPIIPTDTSPNALLRTVDVVFPVLHGPMGEDGTIQGLLELADIPYVGSGVLGSALAMEKVRAKQMLRFHDLPVTDWVSIHRHDWRTDGPGALDQASAFGFPCFVKPSALGSSVGVSKVKSAQAMPAALTEAFRHGERALVEPAIDGREIEVSVVGNHRPEASVPGEIVPSNEFYDYAAKYLDGKSQLYVPAQITSSQSHEVRSLALRAFSALGCAGLARVDFFLERDTNRWYVNEVNTMPGFTSISMYPKLWEASGLGYRELVTRLVELAIERWEDRRPASDA